MWGLVGGFPRFLSFFLCFFKPDEPVPGFRGVAVMPGMLRRAPSWWVSAVGVIIAPLLACGEFYPRLECSAPNDLLLGSSFFYRTLLEWVSHDESDPRRGSIVQSVKDGFMETLWLDQYSELVVRAHFKPQASRPSNAEVIAQAYNRYNASIAPLRPGEMDLDASLPLGAQIALVANETLAEALHLNGFMAYGPCRMAYAACLIAYGP